MKQKKSSKSKVMSHKGQVRNVSGTKSWDGRKQSRSTKNKGFGSC